MLVGQVGRSAVMHAGQVWYTPAGLPVFRALCQTNYHAALSMYNNAPENTVTCQRCQVILAEHAKHHAQRRSEP